ncbi:HaeII family restriction endonuclease, partial [Candidatus Wolfebacteria bacterium]|nr:HaeII family restriction endonuclease [Candidatus Wolfebacteria bacterium]
WGADFDPVRAALWRRRGGDRVGMDQAVARGFFDRHSINLRLDSTSKFSLSQESKTESHLRLNNACVYSMSHLESSPSSEHGGYSMASQELLDAKETLDKLISKQRVALYKPIQIAEILYHARTGELKANIGNNLEAYRNPSKKWRDIVTTRLIGQFSTSSQKYQDNLFEANALPPKTLDALAKENKKYQGIVERYIYQQFWIRQQRIMRLWDLLEGTTIEKFDLNEFIAEFVMDKHIKRSIDKAYEIIVYALFSTLVKHLNVKVTLSIDPAQGELLKKFEVFATLVLGVDSTHPNLVMDAKLYRAGATNAADRGLDMWANFGPIVQVKHLTISEELADDISDQVAADRIIIVCKDGDKEIIEKICRQLRQMGQRIQGVVVQSQLATWYEEAMRGQFSPLMGDDLLNSLRQEFQNEFPYSTTFNEFYQERKYHLFPQNKSLFWLDEQ